MSMILDGSNGLTFNDASTQPTSASNYLVFKNRIINGDMRIDQRNAGASVSIQTSTGYTLDRWSCITSQNSKYTVQRNAGSVTPPVGFTNYLGVTSSSAYTVTSGDYAQVRQLIEGYNAADLAWGTANAKQITISFWVRSSLTGTFGGALRNVDATRSYPFTYTISSANTWEQKTLTISGDTTGTWNTTNDIGLEIGFNIGTGSTYSGTAGSWAGTNYVSATGATSVLGTNGATLYITGVQLEVGSTATPFERRMYTTELQLCQRYYWKLIPNATWYNDGPGIVTSNWNTVSSYGYISYPVSMRTNPTLSYSSATDMDSLSAGTLRACTTITSTGPQLTGSDIWTAVASGLTAGYSSFMRFNKTTSYLAYSAEL